MRTDKWWSDSNSLTRASLFFLSKQRRSTFNWFSDSHSFSAACALHFSSIHATSSSFFFLLANFLILQICKYSVSLYQVNGVHFGELQEFPRESLNESSVPLSGIRQHLQQGTSICNCIFCQEPEKLEFVRNPSNFFVSPSTQTLIITNFKVTFWHCLYFSVLFFFKVFSI